MIFGNVTQMKLSQLRTFVAVADNGGVARAAVRLNLTQSAASRQISALESELAVALFDRIGRRVQLTSEGEDLLSRSRRLVGDVEALGERARALKAGQAGLLRVGATPQVIECLLADYLTGYRRRHPNIEVHLIEDGGARLPDRLERGDVHLTIMPASGRGFHGRLLYPMHLLAALPVGHPLSKHTVLEIEKLADQSLLLLDGRYAARTWFEAACHVAHIDPHVLLYSAAPHTIMRLARTGYGIAIVPSQMMAIPREGIRTVPLVHRRTSIGKWAMIAWAPQRFLAPYAGQFVNELVASVRRDFPGRDLVRRAPALPPPKEPAN
jgi:LysR family transcriptional regulator, cyn operon transcriptional activator